MSMMGCGRKWALRVLAGCLVMALLPCASAATQSEALRERAYERRAVEAAIWGMPLVNFDAMRQAAFRDAGAQYNDLLFWSSPSDWRNQTTTPNHSTLYVMFFVNLTDGAVVVEVPETRKVSLYGSLLNAWNVPLENVGSKGLDQGRGGRYLLLPPDFQGAVPDGYIPIRMNTFNGYSLLRVIPRDLSSASLRDAGEQVRRLAIYPLAKAGAPVANRIIDMAGKSFEGLPAFDAGFFDSLARMVSEEPVQAQDLSMMGQLRSLQLGKEQAFKPTPAQRRQLDAAAGEAHAYMSEGFATSGVPTWPGQRRWRSIADPEVKAVSQGRLDFFADTGLLLDERAFLFFAGYAPPKPPKQQSTPQVVYLKSFEDAQGNALDGGKRYRLHLPAGVPAEQFWAVDAYDYQTAGFIREAPIVGLDSYSQSIKRNADGSIDLLFAPAPVQGEEGNWISTRTGQRYFLLFRFYGPKSAILDRSWTLGDLERLSH